MKEFSRIGSLLAVAMIAASGTPALAKQCPPDSALVGMACINKYEASVWGIPATSPGGKNNAGLIKKVQKGKATLADLTAGGATQFGTAVNDYPCAANGSNCKGQIYAVSIPGVLPSSHDISWFQALQACGNSLERLPTNAEWQLAALGTPDPGANNGTTDCNVNFGAFTAVNTGSRSSCVSPWGVWDMVGNVIEYVQEWVPRSTLCTSATWTGGGFNNDLMCLFDVDTSARFPAALVRGGRYESGDGAAAGAYAIAGDIPPTGVIGHLGFRCAR